MPQTNISGADYSNMSGVVQDRTVETKTPDSAGDTDETVWENTKFSQYYGYYKKIPELKTAIDMRAVWTIGKGYETDDAETQVILDHISGFGCDTFNSVLKKLMIMKRVAGDSFAEVMRDEDSGLIVNIKPLNPGSIRIVTDRWGIIKRYEQYDGNSKAKTAWAKFNPEEILHLTNKRVADEIHGVSDRSEE